MNKTPDIDILVPVWNNPFETRACLAAILLHSPSARLIIVDNGSSRETQLMLEEFSESLGDQGLFITSDRNIGLVAAINLGLARSDSDYTVIVSPQVTVSAGWLDELVGVALSSGAGIVSPLFEGAGAPALPPLAPGCSVMESSSVSFYALLLSTEMRIVAGLFDDTLDGDVWCLKDYVSRVSSFGYRTCLAGRLRLSCVPSRQFGSLQRRNEMVQYSSSEYSRRWGVARHYAVYFGAAYEAAMLDDIMQVIVNGARQGHRFTLLLHHRQARDFKNMGWNGLHTCIELQSLGMLMPVRALGNKIKKLKSSFPELLIVCADGAAVPGEVAVGVESLVTCFSDLAETVTNQNPEAI